MLLYQRMNPELFAPAYGAKFQQLYPKEMEAPMPFGAAWGILEPGQVSSRHSHHEHESLFIVSGAGRLTCADEVITVGPGDTIYLAPFGAHMMENLSPSEELLFLSVWCEDLSRLAEDPVGPAANGVAARNGYVEEVIVTATPPTPNGDLHIGHLSGPYLAADILVRHLRTRGIAALYLTGIDDHQSYTALKGIRTDATPAEVADHFGDAILATLDAARIEPDGISLPRASALHTRYAHALFHRLHGDGAIVERNAPALYCTHCRMYLFEAFVRGGCPHCHAPSNGNACEECGRPNDCADLIEPRCNVCQAIPERRSYRRFYFRLASHAEMLESYHETVTMSSHLRALCATMLSDGLPEIAISHETEWGIPVPLETHGNQRLYVWFEMIAGYLAAADGATNDGRVSDGAEARPIGAGWKGGRIGITQCFGFDNGYFHAILFPALLHALDPEIELPRHFITNEFYRLDGLKISTSRDHAIWGRELIDAVGADVARFYLAYSAPEREQTNFVRSDFEAVVRRELIDGCQQWLAGVEERIAREFGRRAPSTGVWTVPQREFYHLLQELTRRAAAAYRVETFSPQRAARVVRDLVQEARRFSGGERHWRDCIDRSEERRTGVALELAAAKCLARIAYPIMPDFALALWRSLGLESSGGPTWVDFPDWVPSGGVLGPIGGPYFPSGADIAEYEADAMPRGA